MLRAAAWTGGLFGAGTAICHVFSASWLEPVVLLALGATLLVVSARSGSARRSRAVAAKQAAA